MLIGSVSQVALNHIGLLIVDEIQNVVNNKNGKSLMGMLTQLINNSGISICMVGTPESTILISAFSLIPAYQILQRDPYQKLTANNSGIDFFVTLSHRYLLALSSCILILAFSLRSSEYGADMR